MAKSRKPVKVAATSKRKRTRSRMSAGAEREVYKRILVDPCYGELPSSPYESAAGGIVARVRQTALAPALNNTAMAVFFHPVFGSFAAEVANVTTATSFRDFAGAYQQVGNTNAARAVAGCVSATYIGAESGRSGIMHCGVVSGALVSSLLGTIYGGNGNTITMGALSAGLSHIERTPVDKCEVNWVPGEGDSSFSAVTFAAASSNQIETLLERTNFCVIVVTGLNGAANLIEWNFTGVVETVPAASNNLFNNAIAFDVSTSTRTKFDYRDVVRELGAKDPSWFIGTFKKAWKFIGGLAKGYATAGMPGALGYLIGASPSENVGSRQYLRSGK